MDISGGYTVYRWYIVYIQKKRTNKKKTLGVSANSNQKKSQSAQKSASKNTPMDSCDFLIEGLCLPLTVDFLGEQGIDAGGLRPSVWS